MFNTNSWHFFQYFVYSFLNVQVPQQHFQYHEIWLGSVKGLSLWWQVDFFQAPELNGSFPYFHDNFHILKHSFYWNVRGKARPIRKKLDPLVLYMAIWLRLKHPLLWNFVKVIRVSPCSLCYHDFWQDIFSKLVLWNDRVFLKARNDCPNAKKV